MNIEFSENEKKYLKRMAALQFPGSRENFSTRHPIHFLQEQTDEYIEVPVDEYDCYKDEIVRVELSTYDFFTYDSVDELVADQLDIDLNDENDVAQYNKYATPQFVSYACAEEKGSIPGYDGVVNTVSDYLEAYDISESRVRFFRYAEGWDVKAISFTHKGTNEMREELDNHIFRPTRTYAFTTVDGDFPVLMGFLLKCGKKLLDEETEGITLKKEIVLSQEEILQRYRKRPNVEFRIALYEFILPAHMSEDNEEHRARIQVMATGEIKEFVWSQTGVPIAKLRVIYDVNGLCKECEYPFECDNSGKALFEDDRNKLMLLNFARYY